MDVIFPEDPDWSWSRSTPNHHPTYAFWSRWWVHITGCTRPCHAYSSEFVPSMFFYHKTTTKLNKNRCQDSRSATLSSSCQKKCIRSSCGTYILYILSNLVVLRNENGHDNYYRNKITTNLLFGCLTVCGTGLLTQIIPVISAWNLKHPL